MLNDYKNPNFKPGNSKRVKAGGGALNFKQKKHDKI